MDVSTVTRCSLALLLAAGLLPPAAAAKAAATPTELLAGYTAKAGTPPSAGRGQKFFNTSFGRDFDWSCATCHGAVPTGSGKDAATEKRIDPLAPAYNPLRFTDAAKVENAFRVNCRDVLGRECSAAEKADILVWLLTLKP